MNNELNKINVFKGLTGCTNVLVTPLNKAGSNRQYFRLILPDGTTQVGVIGTSREENNAFVTLSRHFASKDLNVPKVFSVSDDLVAYTQTDLGSVSLYDAIASGRASGGNYSDEEKELLCRTIAALPRIQIEGDKGLDYSVCYPQPEFDERNIMFDLNYFKYCFLKLTDIDFHEVRLDDDFHAFAHDLLTQSGPWGFMVRDFQARNVMLVGDSKTPFLIDFQGGRRGPILYDLVSFLWQAAAQYPDELRQELIQIYLDNLDSQLSTANCQLSTINSLVLFRTLQVLGAYGFRGYIERKPHFLNSIPMALANLASVIDAACLYPHLYDVLTRLTEGHLKHSNTQTLENTKPQGLTVRIFSFSYKCGIPEDASGNGGGYVFDCRSTHNPGRYEPYKKLTGLDKPVIDFLERDGEITTFLNSVYALADAHVQRYIDRGFTNLMFSFGCTGGQHRSVYSAQHLGEHLYEKFASQGIKVQILHREQGIMSEF